MVAELPIFLWPAQSCLKHNSCNLLISASNENVLCCPPRSIQKSLPSCCSRGVGVLKLYLTHRTKENIKGCSRFKAQCWKCSNKEVQSPHAQHLSSSSWRQPKIYKPGEFRLMNSCIQTVLLTKWQRGIYQAKGSQSDCSLQLIQPADSTGKWINSWCDGNKLLPSLLLSLSLCWAAVCAPYDCVVDVFFVLLGKTAEHTGLCQLLWLQQLLVLL